jgi:hypothetical protein
MPFAQPDIAQDDGTWTDGEIGAFIHVPLAWRKGQAQLASSAGPEAEIEEALKDLHAAYHDLPIPDRLLDLVRRVQG